MLSNYDNTLLFYKHNPSDTKTMTSKAVTL